MEKHSRKQIIDLSSFFLVEDSGDSEAESNASGLVEMEEDDDDAGSSCDGLSGWASKPDHEIEICGHGYGFQDCGVVDRAWEEEEEEEEGEVNMLANRRRSDSNTCIQGRERYQQPENEIDRNKMFWETCLATGF